MVEYSNEDKIKAARQFEREIYELKTQMNNKDEEI